MNIKKTIKFTLITIIIGFILFGSYKIIYKKNNTENIKSSSIATKFDIRPFEPQQDTEFIKQLNNDNWYLLHASPDYDVDFMLEKSAPYIHEPRYYGKLTTVVIFDEQGKHAGFVNFYMRGLYEGTVFLLAVDQNARGKGYGEALMRYAIEGLRRQNAHYIKLSVRKKNETAKKLYHRCGFTHESSEGDENGFDFYRLNLN